ncbi:glycosyltransferase [Nesterenkonia rhizosphaerae]|uniref:Glycosyltransferase 2-like domain-containing protein n=1 Tax=Nesterenkonia rhizosphaerae TaxID=1348272 RepID=A0ABP9FXD9_9MICC
MKFKVVNFQAGRISGWFYDSEAVHSGAPVLDLRIDGETVDTLTCNIFRGELPESDFLTRNVGFLGALPASWWTGSSYRVQLVHRASDQLLHEEVLEAPDATVDEAGGLNGQFLISSRAQVAGWAAVGDDSTRVRIVVDGQLVEDARAGALSLPWRRDRFNLQGPVGRFFGTQLPGEFFDDEMHDVRVFARDSRNLWISIAQQRLLLPSSERESAERERTRIRDNHPEPSDAWLRQPTINDNIKVEQLSVTGTYACVSLSGDVTNRRAVLRIGESEALLQAITPTDNDELPRKSLHYFAGAISVQEALSGSFELHRSGTDLNSSYDLHMGDVTGRQPQGMSECISIDVDGELLTSEVRLDGGTLTGWAVHTAAVDAPLDLVLEEVTGQETSELARTQNTMRNKQARLETGLRQIGFALVLPARVLEPGPFHLRLKALHAGGEEILWESWRFKLADEQLLELALEASTGRRALALLSSARRAGREEFVRMFLARFAEAKSDITLTDVEDAIIEYRDPRPETLEPSSGAVWYWVKELRSNPGRIQWFTQNAIRNRNGGVRDVLAYAASKGRYDFGQLHGLLESCRSPQFRDEAVQALADHWKTAVLSLARFLYAAPRDETDHLDSLTLYSLVESWHGIQDVVGPDRSFYGDLLRWRGELSESARVLNASDPDDDHDYSQQLLSLNALNPSHSDVAPRAWLDRFNEILEAGGAAPVELADAKLSFYALRSGCAPRAPLADSDPLVSVIMPIYEPTAALDVAVESLLRQTWRNLEIIMVDDCSPVIDAEGSPTQYRKRLQRLAARDDRIRLVLNERNRGAYSARNDGLDLARGELITIADKDDWHHPRQLELQVRDLLADPDKIANMTNWVRVDESLNFRLRSATGRVIYPSMPSLMFRRNPVFKDLGYWDTVRKSGDSEFKSRIENFYGVTIEPIVKAPLALALMEGGNLTQDDMGVGYLAPDRRAYLRAYKRWHRSIREERESAFMPKESQRRAFVAPHMYLPGSGSGGGIKYDVVFASEFGFLAGNSTSLFTEISVCLNAGLRVGVLPFQNGLIPSAAKRQFNQKVDDLVFSGQVDRLSHETDAETDLLVIRWPTAVQVVPDRRAGLRAKRAVVVANHPPFEPGGRRSYDIGVVTRNVEHLFGLRPSWAPQSEQVGALLQPLMPDSDLEDFSWKGIIRIKDAAQRNRFREGPPVIGRHGRDDVVKWPSDRDVFSAVYPVDGTANVCILGGAKIPVQKGFLPRGAQGWEVYAFNEIEVDEYLREKLDFFVYFHSEGWLEAFGMAILEAMSYGVVCVLPTHFEQVFKDAAVYAKPSDVQDVVQHMWHPERYREQQRNALRFIQNECTPDAYIRRLRRLGVYAQPAVSTEATSTIGR